MGCIFSANAQSQRQSQTAETYIKSKYKLGKTLGKGESCRVVVAKDKSSKDKFAMKILSVNSRVNGDLYEKEKKILKVLDHPNILKLVECHQDSKNFYIATELLEGGELFDRIIDEKYAITEKMATRYVKTMLLAIEHCHEKNIVHRDIKPENFVFKTKDRESEMVLIDFGCAMHVERNTWYKELVGTPYYLSPEVAAGDRYVRTGEVLMSSDMWGIGVITYVLMTGRPPFNGFSNSEILRNIIKQPLEFPKDVKLSEAFTNFCLEILKKSPKRRMRLEDALKDQWVQGEQLSNARISGEVITVLRQFNNQSKLKKAITKVLAEHMGKKSEKTIREQFSLLDKDSNNKVCAVELTTLLMNLGWTEVKAKEEAAIIIAASDDDQSGFIEINEFASIWQRKLLSTNEEYIHTIFSVLDSDADGQIDCKELAKVLNLTNDENEEKIQGIIKEVDKDEDGKIDFEEFRAAMLERNDFSGHGAQIGCKLNVDEIRANEKNYVDIDDEAYPGTDL